jgi:pSer/pThr/pTyr-binding forkhead associated (FHA) protein
MERETSTLLQVLRAEKVLQTFSPPLNEPLLIGRAPGNGLVLESELISWHHAMLWVEGGRLWVKDIGSTNGTFIDDNRVLKPTPIEPGCVLRLGADITIRFKDSAQVDLRYLFIEEVGTPGLNPIRTNRFYFGTDEDADLVLDDGPGRAATIQIHRDGELWLGTDEGEHSLEIGEIFEVQGREFRVCIDVNRTPTVLAGEHRYPYSLTVNLQGATGPIAELRNMKTGRTFEIQSTNRVVLLYILARQIVREREQEDTPDEEGWCRDEEVSSGIWGRNWQDHSAGHLHVLVHRLRNQIKQGGFDPWFIEKKRRHVRLCLQEVEVL